MWPGVALSPLAAPAPRWLELGGFLRSPQRTPPMPHLKVLADTWLKREPVQSVDLTAADKMPIKAGTEFAFTEYRLTDNGHSWFKFPSDAWQEGYLYLPHIESDTIEAQPETSQEPDEAPRGSATDPERRRKERSYIVTTVPGVTRLDMYDPVHAENSPNIYWYELLHFNGRSFRRPENSTITQNLVKLAGELQGIRDRYGRPMTITSAYRDPVTNRRVGGARFSEHVKGGAADFRIQGVSPWRVFRDLDAGWDKPLASSNSFTHIGVVRSVAARWSYGR